MNIYLMIGAPGAGKSHYCEKAFHGLEIISCDQLREELFGDRRSFEIREVIKNKIKEIVMARVKGAKEDIVLDTTYFNEAHEREFLFLLDQNISINAIFVKTELDLCLIQNKKRAHERVVSEEMVEMLFGRVCPPDYAEGFNSIKIVTTQEMKP
ncbi:ATP-binding protein [Pseudomonas anguilliseptica]|uniref:ATP-binding protein n=1 Tax=Pseudomonas anguilliseptica TaxID=53406 RepID=UPI001F3A562B|nr:ATP-binding protein [Pseudomonas anguilliseptica]MCE5364410.1 AAA family ATPase [Pseudomonas anguilliseptica]